MRAEVLSQDECRKGEIRMVRYGLRNFVVEIYAPLAGKWSPIDGMTFRSRDKAGSAYAALRDRMERRVA